MDSMITENDVTSIYERINNEELIVTHDITQKSSLGALFDGEEHLKSTAMKMIDEATTNAKLPNKISNSIKLLAIRCCLLGFLSERYVRDIKLSNDPNSKTIFNTRYDDINTFLSKLGGASSKTVTEFAKEGYERSQ